MELTIEQALQRAVEAHKAGKLQDAEALYRAILQTQPKHPDANHNLGIMAVFLNKTEASLPLFKIALEANPNQGQFWLSYVDALIKEKQFDNARNVLVQGRELGLAGGEVDALETQLKTMAVAERPESILHKQPPSFTQHRKKVSVAREKKKNSSSNQKIPNQLRHPTQMEISGMLEHYQKGRLDLAENLAKIITLKYPHHQLSWEVLGAVFKQTGRLQESLITNQRLVAISPNDAAAHYNLGNTLKELGKLEDAVVSFKKAIAIKPDLAEAHSNLGITLKQLGKIEDARASFEKAIVIKPGFAEAYYNLANTLKELGRPEDARTSFKKAIAIKPELAEAHYNLGITLKELSRLEDAEASFKNAIAIKPKYAEVHSNLGITLNELGRLEDAEASFKKAIAIKPEYAEAHYNLGITLRELGRLEDAAASYKKAIAIKPDFAEAHSNLGNTLNALGRLEDAQASHKVAIAIKPDLAEAHSNLGNTLNALGRLEDALDTVINSIKIRPTIEAKNLFVVLIKEIGIKTWDQSLAQLVITALLEPWGRPSDLMPIACKLLKTNKEFLQILKEQKKDINQTNKSFFDSVFKNEFSAAKLLREILSSGPVPDAEIEIFLTSLRRHFLNTSGSVILEETNTEEVSSLFCSLAQQCFINEYVYFQTPEEIRRSQQLRDQLRKALKDRQNVPAVWVIAVACYFPLYSVADIEILNQQKWSDDVKSVLKQQIQEPLVELNLRASIPVLTSIDNQVSVAVQSQYEENPYPRWMRLPKDSNKVFLNSHIQIGFPLSLFTRLIDDRNPEILIAGCGTGQHSIFTSQQFKGARILAVDLSMASLAYAKRKTIELDIECIEYAQADLLKLAALGRTFDVIESVGVLHHLENPFEGWEVLLSLLRPHGLMRLGFYSELARKDIVGVRNLISNQGVGTSPHEIRDYRKHMLGLKNVEDYGFATSSSDFFSTSACRDLLFHVQEHRMNVKVLADFLKDHDLNFLGFHIKSSVIRAYKNRFPNDPSATNLDQWHIYEEENPHTFVQMYQFWIQKK
jgi:tetratricopeptide (TPR) repeat protein/2-polyprenyl-3-methyl-5-hydroxy-6-metoxy-1,4-benzoquinol methylase